MDAVTEALLARLAAEAGLGEAAAIVRPVGGEAVALRPGAGTYPASMIKTPLVAAALIEVERGRLRLTDRLEITAANMTYNDAPSPLEPGYWARLDELCTLAISRSDNVATNVLFDVVGRARATEIAQRDLRLPATSFHRKLSGSDPLIDDPGWDGVHMNTHPVADAAALFEAITLDRVPHADLIRSALAHQYWNDKLSRGLLTGDTFAHKTGDTSQVTHDGGVLTTAAGDSYVIVVYTTLSSSEAHNARFGPFMRALRAHL